MEESPISSIQVMRINVETSDTGPGATWLRAVTVHPWLTRRHLDELRSLHPSMQTTELTSVGLNVSAWSSMSDYLEEMEGDPHASAIAEGMCGGVTTFEAAADYGEAERVDGSRAIPLFTWDRPLVRMATHVVVMTAAAPSSEGVERLSGLLGGCVITRADAASMGLLACSSPTEVEALVHQGLAPGRAAPMPWRPEWKSLIQNRSEEEKQE